jgi:formylmethanofuran:tetrahydromethanopterin formyltransferase
MKKKIATLAAAAALAAVVAVPAAAAPADGQCVSNGVAALGGQGFKAIGAAANGSLAPTLGLPEGTNLVPIVIADHLRNGADLTETLLAGAGLIPDGTQICD